MKYLLLLFGFIWGIWGSQAFGHQFMPAYPKLERSYVDTILMTKMELFNSRSDVEYYELSVFDAEWNSVPFATEQRIVNVEYLKRKTIEIYIREQDRSKAVYICSKSKIRPSNIQATVVSSRICSKIK
jgi:hypothetical protein